MQSNPSSGIASNTYICLLGLLPAVRSLLGYDSTAHMIEETKDADAIAGWPMPYAVALGGISGLPFLIALTLCIQVALTSAVMCHVSVVPTSFHKLCITVGVARLGLSMMFLFEQCVMEIMSPECVATKLLAAT